jgi:hypothetical protein
VYKHVVSRGIKVHRSVLTRLEALDKDGKAKTYVPLIRPNIVVHEHDEGGDHERHLPLRRMTHDEWMSRRVSGKDEDWFQWLELKTDDSSDPHMIHHAKS